MLVSRRIFDLRLSRLDFSSTFSSSRAFRRWLASFIWILVVVFSFFREVTSSWICFSYVRILGMASVFFFSLLRSSVRPFTDVVIVSISVLSCVTTVALVNSLSNFSSIESSLVSSRGASGVSGILVLLLVVIDM